MTYIASKDCDVEGCRGTAMWEISCQQYVCNSCGRHVGGNLCATCEWRANEREGFTIDPEEGE